MSEDKKGSREVLTKLAAGTPAETRAFYNSLFNVHPRFQSITDRTARCTLRL